jgi:hypothetical protein
MSEASNKICAIAALTLCAPPLLLVLAWAGRSSELLIASFLLTSIALLVNSLLLVSVMVMWFVGAGKVARGKPIMLISLLCAGVVTDVLILRLMPPLAK